MPGMIETNRGQSEAAKPARQGRVLRIASLGEALEALVGFVTGMAVGIRQGRDIGVVPFMLGMAGNAADFR